MATQLQLVSEAPKQGRVNRYPRHDFTVRFKPWQITPFFIAPVLPGETMKNLLCQTIAITPLLQSRLTGWWFEQYFFYVKHRDLIHRDNITAMHLDPAIDLNATLGSGGADANTYLQPGQFPWLLHSLNRIVDTYFRSEGETYNNGTVGGLSMASINVDNWLDSAKLAARDYTDNPDLLPGQLGAETPYIPAGFENHYAQWEHMKASGLVTATFDDYLKSFGLRPGGPAAVDDHVPELIRYVKQWKMPTAIVQPVTNTPGRGCVWEMSERADKDRFFSEPGMIVGVCVARPKVFLKNQNSSAMGLLSNCYSWLPAILQDSPFTSLRPINAASAPLPATVSDADGAVWVDLRDLFIYGEQFTNFGVAATDAGMVALPDGNLNRRYASQADIDALIVGADKNVRAEGVVSMTIASRIADTSGIGGGGRFAS